MKDTTTNNKTIQELIIPAFDIHHKEFGTGTGNEKNKCNAYEIRKSPDNAAILKSILCKSSHSDTHPTIQFIHYGIQGITNKDIYKIIIKKQNAFIVDSSIIQIYDIEERELNKFKQLIKTTMYLQDIESTHESRTKGKYFLITTKSDYKKAIIEAKYTLQYVYPNRKSANIHYSSKQVTPLYYCEITSINHSD